jgi:hypothetical protein
MSEAAEKKSETGLDLAYPLAVAAYDVAQARLQVVEKRVQEVLAFGVASTAGVTTFLVGQKYSFKSWWFYVGLGFFAVGAIICIWARTSGTLNLIKPGALHDKYKDLTPEVFKVNFLKCAGQHWDTNVKLINRKGWWTNVAIVSFLCALTALVVWAMANPPI